MTIFTACTTHAPERPPGPNILLITLDTLRADYIGCYGSVDVKTPNIDSLARAGVKFERHITASQCTNPSHTTIFTGLYPSIHQVFDNQTPLTDKALTLPEILRENGYFTFAAVSAYHLNPVNSNFGQGFDEFLTCEQTELTAEERNKEVFELLDDARDKRFYGWIHYYDPHGPYRPPAEFERMYPSGNEHSPVKPEGFMDLSEEQRKLDSIDPDVLISRYKGEVTYLDSELGRLFDHLKKLNIFDNTIIILVSDHGESMTEKDIFFCHAGLYNTVTHVPFIMYHKNKLPGGLVIKSETSSIDIFPTVLGLAGVEYPAEKINGKSLVPLFDNPELETHPFIVTEAVSGVIRAVYKSGYKYIRPFKKDWAVKEDHLFKPWTDYKEENDLRNSQPELALGLKELLKKWVRAALALKLDSKQRKDLDSKTEKALRQLGYLN